jgi:hypothetical protein
MAIAAVDAFEAFEHSLNAADLRPLVIAASSPHKLVFETGCRLLVGLAALHAEAQLCLLQMAKAKEATARFHAVAYLEEALPERLRRNIVQLALSDRSTNVRQKGIEGAERFKFVQFLPQLEEMQHHETSESVQDSLALHIPMLRDGFGLRPSDDGTGYWLTVLGPRASARSFIPKEKCCDEFIREETERLKTATN